jgi:hypothetical protein
MEPGFVHPRALGWDDTTAGHSGGLVCGLAAVPHEWGAAWRLLARNAASSSRHRRSTSCLRRSFCLQPIIFLLQPIQFAFRDKLDAFRLPVSGVLANRFHPTLR